MHCFHKPYIYSLDNKGNRYSTLKILWCNFVSIVLFYIIYCVCIFYKKFMKLMCEGYDKKKKE